MENLGAMADSRYTGFREITDRYVLELHCTLTSRMDGFGPDNFLFSESADMFLLTKG